MVHTYLWAEVKSEGSGCSLLFPLFLSIFAKGGGGGGDGPYITFGRSVKSEMGPDVHYFSPLISEYFCKGGGGGGAWSINTFWSEE